MALDANLNAFSYFTQKYLSFWHKNETLIYFWPFSLDLCYNYVEN